MNHIIYYRKQKVQAPLLREPNQEELKILLGKDDDASMFDLDIVDFEKEEVLDEDYSSGRCVMIPNPSIH